MRGDSNGEEGAAVKTNGDVTGRKHAMINPQLPYRNKKGKLYRRDSKNNTVCAIRHTGEVKK